jgi:DNA-binding NtrC family response regulator
MSNGAPQILCVYSVVASVEENGRWLEIGKASPHRDGRGFDVVLEALPIGPKLVVRAQAETEAPAENTGNRQASYAQRVAAFERALIERSLSEAGGNISDVMERLCIPRRTLNEKMQRLGIDRHRFVRTGEALPRTRSPEPGSVDVPTPAAILSKAR